MESTETIRKVREDLAEIEKILAWMEKSKEVNQIDIDVLLDKTRHLYNKVISLPVGRTEIQPQPSQPSQPPQPPQPEPLHQEPEFMEAPPAEPLPPVIQAPEPEPEPLRVVIQEPIWVPEPEPAPAPIKHPVRETATEMHLFQRDDSLNDALGKQKPVHDVASSITDIPIADIWSAITINERFLFIRELFGNDPEGFKNTVTLLNSLDNWEAAKKFMSDRFEWDKNNPVAVDFLNVVRRRFLK